MVRKWSTEHVQKLHPKPKFLVSTTEVSAILQAQKFQVSLIYAFIRSPCYFQSGLARNSMRVQTLLRHSRKTSSSSQNLTSQCCGIYSHDQNYCLHNRCLGDAMICIFCGFWVSCIFVCTHHHKHDRQNQGCLEYQQCSDRSDYSKEIYDRAKFSLFCYFFIPEVLSIPAGMSGLQKSNRF